MYASFFFCCCDFGANIKTLNNPTVVIFFTGFLCSLGAGAGAGATVAAANAVVWHKVKSHGLNVV